MKKLISILVALAMTTMLSITAFAANPVATSTEAGEQVPTKLTKAYNKATGVGDPTNQTFNFTAENKTVEGYKSHSDVTATVNGANSLSIADIFGADNLFNEAGKYRFEVTEDLPQSANASREVVYENTTNPAFKVTETTTYSAAKYQVDLVVASYTDPNTLETSYYVQSAAVTRLLDDNGNGPAAKPEGDPTADGDGINLTFTNKVNKEIENVKDPESPPTTQEEDKNALEISKTTALAEGVEAGTAIPDQEFNFKATVAFPANTKADSYTTVIKEVVDGEVTEVDAGPTFTPSALTKTFTLKNGQWLAFTDIEAGATVTVEEDTYPGFTPTGLQTNYVVKDTGNNAIDVTNKYDPSEGTVTGILMSNIPYIVLALVAIGGLCAYVVVRRKNADEA